MRQKRTPMRGNRLYFGTALFLCKNVAKYNIMCYFLIVEWQSNAYEEKETIDGELDRC